MIILLFEWAEVCVLCPNRLVEFYANRLEVIRLGQTLREGYDGLGEGKGLEVSFVLGLWA